MSDISERDFYYADADFARAKAIIYRHAGIHLNENKKQLVYSRLARRLRSLKIDTFANYLDYLDETPEEQQEFINALTTNLTSFFREEHHFDILTKFISQRRANKACRIWCAASSTGEEPYSIAMTVAKAYQSYKPPVEIVASDIDSQVLRTAASGVYNIDRLDALSLDLKQQFFLRGKGANLGKAKVIPELRNLIDFRQINLLDRRWSLEGKFDVIFCRNVMIYFDKPTQLSILEKMTHLLVPDGLYIAGHSENFSQANHLMRLIEKTTYCLANYPNPGARHGF